jgi:hypothetical protein
MPQVVGKKEKPKQGMEWMEVGVVLAKQVLCQLSYTPFEMKSSGNIVAAKVSFRKDDHYLRIKAKNTTLAVGESY